MENNNVNGNSNTCSICLDRLHHGPVGATVPCGHVFHVTCFRDWQQRSSSPLGREQAKCPNCNAQTTSFVKLFLNLYHPEKPPMAVAGTSGSSLSASVMENANAADLVGGEEEPTDDVISDGGVDRHGCFVFQAQIPLAVRRAPSVREQDKVNHINVIQENELVSVDYIRHSRFSHDDDDDNNNNNGPFLRLSDCSGWLFERKYGEKVMRQLEVSDGLWTFFADNHPTGVALRRHPVDRQDTKVEPEVAFLPMQKIVCDKHVQGPNGVSYYRVQGTDGWVFDKRGDNYMIIPESKVRQGLFVYRAKAHLSVRNTTNVGDCCKTPFIVRENELIAADVIRESPYQDSNNGPFLRLTDGSGWLFEGKYGERLMEALHVEEGDWSFRVGNGRIGIALRRQPIDSQDFLVIPERHLPPDDLIFCDHKVRAPNGVNFFRVKGTDGWVFDRRGEEDMLFPRRISPQSTTMDHALDRNSWSHDKVRRIASAVPGVHEIDHNADSRLISFRTSGGVRVNVYYTTRTVGTAMNHPLQGMTQLFRRNCSVVELCQILRNPRVHTGKGYQSRKRARLSDQSSNNTQSEEDALRTSLKAFDDELALVVKRRSQIHLQLKSFDKRHSASATQQLEKTTRIQQEADRLEKNKAKKEAERKAEEKLLERQKRGDNFEISMFSRDEIKLQGSAQLIAMGGRATLMLDKSFGFRYTSGLTTGVYKLLHTRALSHPRPTYVSLGSNNRYYIVFANGKAQWSSNEAETFCNIVRNNRVKLVAFGMHWDSYVIVTPSNTHCRNVPNQLVKVLRGNNRPIHSVSLGPSGEYFVTWRDGSFKGGGWSNTLNNAMVKLKRNRWHVRDVKFGDDGSYIIRYSSFSGPF